MPTITPFLWFDTQAEEAAEFYVSIFPNSKIGRIARRTDAAPDNACDVLLVEFELDGRRHLALNGGPHYKFNEAVSLMVHCKTQDEIDHYWSALAADGGEEVVCGWLKDRGRQHLAARGSGSPASAMSSLPAELHEARLVASVKARRLLARPCHIFGVAAAELMNAVGRQFQHAV